jgi:hypothetical protein
MDAIKAPPATTLPAVRPSPADLAKRINEKYSEIVTSLRTTFIRAVEIGERPEVKQSERSLAEALYPRPDRDQQLWSEICKRQRDNFLRGWRGERGR